MDLREWLHWRGGAHIFPSSPGITYQEWAGRHMGSEWGEGLLDQRYGDPTLKCVNLPEDAAACDAAEVLLFGTGCYVPPFAINGHQMPLPNLAQLAGNGDRFPELGSTVYRSFHLAPVAASVLRPGFNALQLAPTHAFVQVALIRLFEAGADTTGASLQVERDAGEHALTFLPPAAWQVRAVDFFAAHAGLGPDASGVESGWQATANRALDRWEQYVASEHLGTATRPPWEVRWSPDLVPEGSLRFRCRVHLEGGRVVESPGGIVEVRHLPNAPVRLVRPERFRPFGFHENGWQQEKEFECRYRLDLVGRPSRAVLRMPIYGSVRAVINGRRTITAEAPRAGYYVRDVELDPGELLSGENTLLLRSSGGTGSYQIPGPMLIVVER